MSSQPTGDLYPFLFKPIYKQIMWGGDMLETHLHRDLPETTTPIAESWDVSDRPDGESEVENGPMRGVALGALIRERASDLLGDKRQFDRFPLLVKIIDAGKRLSLQVHPDETAAREIGGGAEPKTEMWYVIAAQKGAKIMAGLKPNATKLQFTNMLASPEVEGCLQIYDSVPGDAFFINSGRIHAIGAGNLLLEIQQNSNTTYRVSDWGRLGVDGKPRELHVEQALRCVDFMDRTSARVTGASDSVDRNRKYPIINKCPFFNVDDLRLVADWRDDTGTSNSFHLLTPINHSVTVRKNDVAVQVAAGRTCLVPARFGSYTIFLDGEAETTVIKTSL